MWSHSAHHCSHTRFLASLLLAYVWQNHKHFRDAVLWLGSTNNSLARGRRWSKAGTASWDEYGAAESPISQGQVKRTRSSPVTCWTALEDGSMAGIRSKLFRLVQEQGGRC